MCSSADGTLGHVRRRPDRANENRGKLGCLIFVLAVLTVGTGQAQAPQLLEQYKCNFCHAEREAKTGPAFVEIAASYKGNPKAADTLAATIRKGTHGSGPWQMPPHPEVSAADARVMVRYILSLQE